LQYYLGGLCNCRVEEGCVPWTKTPGYDDPDRTKDMFWKRKVKKDEPFCMPVAITELEVATRTKVLSLSSL